MGRLKTTVESVTFRIDKEAKRGLDIYMSDTGLTKSQAILALLKLGAMTWFTRNIKELQDEQA